MQRLGMPDLTPGWRPETPPLPEELANELIEVLKVLQSETESYVQYYEQRFRLEEEHIRELRAMLDKQHELDSRINGKLAGTFGVQPEFGHATGLRTAWAELRTTEYWAIQARTNALNTWKQTTLQPLTHFRHEQERIRRRVKDELRSCVGDHAEMLQTTLPRIRRTYERKCEEFESFRHQQRAIDEQRMLLATVDSNGHSPAHTPGAPQGDSYFSLPQNTTTASSPGGRAPLSLWRKDGWDAAPKRLNALFTRMLDSGPENAPEAQQDTPNPNTLRSHQVLAAKQARAKRDMEEAERAYRKAIFDLETLRIRRNKVLAAAGKSIMQWREGLAQTMQFTCMQQARDSVQMCTSLQNVHQHDEGVASRMLDMIEQEQAQFQANLPTLHQLTYEPPVQFVNYHHGPYRDLIFGVSLVDYAFSHGDGGTRPPLIVSKCIAFMELARVINSPGIYRLSAKQSRIQELSSAIERDESVFEFENEREEPAAVASILKLYLRQLPEPLLAMPWEERMRYTHARDENIRTGFPMLKARIRRLPQIHQATLQTILRHLSVVAAHSANNKMGVSNLAVVFAPVVLSEAHAEVMSIAAVAEEDKTMEDLITYWAELFPSQDRDTLPPVPTVPERDACVSPQPPSQPSSASLAEPQTASGPKTPASAQFFRHEAPMMQVSRSQDSSPTPTRGHDNLDVTLDAMNGMSMRAQTPDI